MAGDRCCEVMCIVKCVLVVCLESRLQVERRDPQASSVFSGKASTQGAWPTSNGLQPTSAKEKS